MKVLVTGASGQLGYDVCEELKRRKVDYVGTSSKELDITDPVAVERITAQAGMDIGDTLIGMHLQRVAVPVRISQAQIGSAHLVCARTRPAFVGGSRAVYDERLL